MIGTDIRQIESEIYKHNNEGYIVFLAANFSI